MIDPQQATRDLARRYLARFGPATTEDLRWWTGWNLPTTRRALQHLPIEKVDLHGQPGIDLADAEPETTEEPVAALLPTLDPTPMGWKTRDWFLGIDAGHIFDRAGNIGPTLCGTARSSAHGRSAPKGELLWKAIADRCAQARDAIEQAASKLHARLDRTAITPAMVRTPLERSLAAPEQ